MFNLISGLEEYVDYLISSGSSVSEIFYIYWFIYSHGVIHHQINPPPGVTKAMVCTILFVG